MQQRDKPIIHTICRTCLENLNHLQYNMFQTPGLKNKFVVCTSLTVEPGDGFPINMCDSCFVKLNDFYEFQQMCHNAMEQFNILIGIEPNQYTIELAIEEDKLATHILMLKETKTELEDKTLDEENQEIIGPEPPTPNKDEETIELEPLIAKTLEELLSSQEEEDNDSDFEYQGVEENTSKSIGIENDDNRNDAAQKSSDKQNNGKPIKKLWLKSKKNFFVCEICNRRFEKEVMLAAHKRIHEGLKIFPCGECDKSFVKLYRLRIHIRTIHERKEGERLLCPEQGCGRTYALQQTLRKHIRDVHKGTGTKRKRTSYVCEDCGKVLTSLSTLKNHRFVHTGQPLPFECPECQKRYITKHKLKEHMNRHAGIKNYVCPHCGAKKTTRTELNTHINFHTKEKTYPCKFCEQIFNNIGNLGRHVRTVHEGIKEYRCKYCNKSFGKAETRKHHEMTHTGEKPHECIVCQKKFIQSVSLHKHMQRHYKASEIISTALARAQPTSNSTQS